jgi:hypothetical protein
MQGRRRKGHGRHAIGHRMIIVPMSFKDANSFVDQHHRHHQATVGAKFCIGVADGAKIVGVAIVGRPVARHLDDGWTLEVNRSCTDETKNANSMLYGAAWRATKALGYRRLITYTQANESGVSLRAAGWRIVAELDARKGWDTPTRPRVNKNDGQARLLWEAS